MKKSVQSPQGAKGLLNALSNRHTGSILDDLSGHFGGGVDPPLKEDGDSSVLDEVSDIVLGSGSGKQGGLGDLLGEVFGKQEPLGAPDARNTPLLTQGVFFCIFS